MQLSTTEWVTDPRPARTRAAIIRAVEAISDDPASGISVNAIVRAAGVSRSAFYAHFADLDALAIAMLVDAFRDIGRDDVSTRVERPLESNRPAHAAARHLIRYISRRRAFFRASLDWRVSSKVHETVVTAYADQVHATMRVLGERVPAGINHADTAQFIAGGTIAMITAWLRDERPANGDATSEDRIVDRLLAAMPDWLVRTG